MDKQNLLDKWAQADADTASAAKGINEKAKMIQSLNAPSTPAPEKPSTESASADKINPKARYGDRGKEKRIDTSEMTRPLGSFEKGTDNVPKTGVYKLHKGEAVIPKKENMKHKKMAAAAEHLSDHKPAKAPKKIKHIITAKAASGGYTHTHVHDHPDHPDEMHVSPNMDGMMDHMMQHMGEQNPGEAEADAGQHGIPQGMMPQEGGQ